MICFKTCRLSDYMFRLSSLGHHQVLGLYWGNYTVYDTIQYVVSYHTLYSFLNKELRPDDSLVKIFETCSHLNNSYRYQSITQQYLKRCLIKDDSNYIFRPNVAIIKFSSESMVVVLYRIGIGMSRWWDLSICDICYMLLLRGTGGGGDLWCALSWGVQLKYVCSLLSFVGLQLLFVHFRYLLLVGFFYGFCGEEKNQRIRADAG